MVLGAFRSGNDKADPRLWQPHAPGDPRFEALTHQASFVTAVLPPEVGPGEYEVGLYLPDFRWANPPGAAAFAVRVASEGVGWWTAGEGEAGAGWGVNTFADLTVVA